MRIATFHVDSALRRCFIEARVKVVEAEIRLRTNIVLATIGAAIKPGFDKEIPNADEGLSLLVIDEGTQVFKYQFDMLAVALKKLLRPQTVDQRVDTTSLFN